MSARREHIKRQQPEVRYERALRWWKNKPGRTISGG